MADACILYLMPHDRLWLDPKIEVAQQDAIRRRLPLAAVTCVRAEQYDTVFLQLQILEAILEKRNIPLITLIGTEAATLPSLVKHSKPVHVYGHGSETVGKQPGIVNHPYKWPGIVIKTRELKKIVETKSYMC